ncbi:unnamed protein product [Clavelina lepadiformis]|uniref:F-box only protein 9 n=1 Tax=Clavelina lepadiformis TaxID=159417 RepID=A0ABP0F5W9_CLALP
MSQPDVSIEDEIAIQSFLEEAAVSDDLERFRKQWKNEVENRYKQERAEQVSDQLSSGNVLSTNVPNARKLFEQGIESERNGSFHDAIHFYRKAVQLDPDIEQRMALDFDATDRKTIEEDVNMNPTDLVAKFNSLSMKQPSEIDLQSVSNQLVLQELNIIQLPSEILCLICRWVASSDMDMKSLELLSETCRKFYVHAKDQAIWRAACEKVWGLKARKQGYLSWRDMYIYRPHVHLDGVYISKVSYFREGDPTVFSMYYKPFQCVEYYRYMRFFADGQVILYTTPDDPPLVVPKLNFENAAQLQFRVGQYKPHLEQESPDHKYKSATITAVLVDAKAKKRPSTSGKRGSKSKEKYVVTDKEYLLELQLTSTSSKKRFNKLSWASYGAKFVFGSTGRSTETDFKLHDQFPPFYFSKVRSYNTYSVAPL